MIHVLNSVVNYNVKDSKESHVYEYIDSSFNSLIPSFIDDLENI